MRGFMQQIIPKRVSFFACKCLNIKPNVISFQAWYNISQPKQGSFHFWMNEELLVLSRFVMSSHAKQLKQTCLSLHALSHVHQWDRWESWWSFSEGILFFWDFAPWDMPTPARIMPNLSYWIENYVKARSTNRCFEISVVFVLNKNIEITKHDVSKP